MKNKAIFAILAIFLMATIMLPAKAWIYPDCSSDLLFERYGPRAGKLMIHLYADDPAEFSALKGGDIDVVDWPLPKSTYVELTSPPYNETIKCANYGPEFGLYIIDTNVYNEVKMGNPLWEDPMTDDNPVYPNPLADVWLRRAIAYLVDRPALINQPTIGAGFGYPMYTTVTPANPKYLLDVYGNLTMPWAWEYSPTAAAAILDAHGFPIGGVSGKREWFNPVTSAWEIIKLKFYIRSDHPGRNYIGNVLQSEMVNIGFYMGVDNLFFATSGTTYQKVMIEKDFHMYTGGWSVGVDPDSFDLWAWEYYWHPGFCYNYAGINNAEFNEAAMGVKTPNTQDEAVEWSFIAQQVQAYNTLSIPLYCVAGNKAYYRTNTGTTEPTKGGTWEGVVNINGYGIDNTWSFLDMHTDAYEESPDMTIDYGFKVPELKMMNPIYASWLFDSNALGPMYDSLLARNASNLGQFIPIVAESWEVGSYTHPIYGTCSKVRFTLRPDATWSDGTPLTTADIYFTYVELKQILKSRGFPNPWWWSNVQYILSFSIIDPYNFEVLLDQKSYWAVGWVGGNYILPKHIWKPIALTGDPQTTNIAPLDPALLVGNGPWIIQEYSDPGKYVSYVRNNNYHRFGALKAEIRPKTNNLNKFDLPAAEMVTMTLENLDLRYALDDIDGTVTVTKGLILITTVTLTNENLNPGATDTYNIWTPTAYGKYKVTVSLTAHLANGRSFPVLFVEMIYVTIKEDIAGTTYYDDIGEATYPYKSELVSPSITVDIQDLARASGAFGSTPGSSKWNAVVDQNNDYKVDIQDIARISAKFGWAG